jgi:hypothetical protein
MSMGFGGSAAFGGLALLGGLQVKHEKTGRDGARPLPIGEGTEYRNTKQSGKARADTKVRPYGYYSTHRKSSFFTRLVKGEICRR